MKFLIISVLILMTVSRLKAGDYAPLPTDSAHSQNAGSQQQQLQPTSPAPKESPRKAIELVPTSSPQEPSPAAHLAQNAPLQQGNDRNAGRSSSRDHIVEARDTFDDRPIQAAREGEACSICAGFCLSGACLTWLVGFVCTHGQWCWCCCLC